MLLTDYLVHFSNVLMLVAYSVRDILWLRLFAVGASLVSIPYFLLQATTLWAPPPSRRWSKDHSIRATS